MRRGLRVRAHERGVVIGATPFRSCVAGQNR